MRKLYYQFRISFSIIIFFIFGIQLSFAQVPSNNNCDPVSGVGGAILLTASTTASCSPYSATTVNATGAGGLAGCVGTADDDVWFKFQATSTSHTITVYGATLQDPVIQLFSGTCTSLISMQCSDTGSSFTESLTQGGLTTGNTYYFRVYSRGSGNAFKGTFKICVTTLDDPLPYCAAENNHPVPNEYIKDFSTSLGTSNISNLNSGFSTHGYGNFTSQSVVANPNSTINFNAVFAGYSQSFNIWIDWNKDNDFTDTGEKVYSSDGYFLNSFLGSIIVPNGTLPGNYRMRIRSSYNIANPSPCGPLNGGGETEDYTFTVFGSTCTTVPTAIVTTAITATSATISWTAPSPAPAAGYIYYYSTSSTPPTLSTTGSGSTAAGVTTALLSGLSPGTTYYVWVRSNCGSVDGLGAWSSSISFTTLLQITNVDICAGGSGSLTATGNCSGSTSSMTINGAWNTYPKAKRIETMTNSLNCQFSDNVVMTYSEFVFQVSVTGSYIFTMAQNEGYDGMAYLVKESFTPGQCGPADTWIVGDDDSGSGNGNEPTLITPELTAGVTYKLVSTAWQAPNGTLTASYQYSVTGPTGGTILTPGSGVIQWYTAASGGTSIGEGSPFNPVGITGSGLADTNTAGTTIFYAACSLNPSQRTPLNFVIRPKASATISALGTFCNSDGKLSIAFTGNAPWSIVYADNVGSPEVTVTGITTNPYLINVNPSSEVTYSLSSVYNSECGLGTVNGTAEFKANTWLGATNDLWTTASNWSKNSVPTATDCVVIPPATYSAKINTVPGFARQLFIKDGGQLDLLNDQSITVGGQVIVESTGTFNIDNNSSLVQIDDVVNLGKINMTRKTQLMYRYDYSYWNSPVSLDSDFSLSDLSSDTLPDKYFKWQPSIGGDHGNWIQIPASTIMDPTLGYIVRAPQTYSTNPTVKEIYTAVFKGTPNNGNISVPVTKGNMTGVTDDDKWNLIGNPYPSAISASAFTAANSTTVDGTLYFWTHNSAPSADNPQPFYGTAVYNYSDADYAMINNLTGTAATLGGVVPNGYIAAGSSFFLKCREAGNVSFTNSMRVAGFNNQFFRTSVASQLSTSTENTLEKHLIRLNMLNNASAFSQIVVGYAENATLEYDNGFDGTRFSSNGTSFYSVIEDYDLGIQARPLPFASSDVVQLGYQTDLIDQFSIQIEELDPLFHNYSVLLIDKDLNVSHDLKQAPYLFETSAGKFDDRFELRYMNTQLATAEFQNNNQLTAYVKDQFLMIKSTQEISSAIIFDVSGKQIQIFEAALNSFENKWRFPFSQGIYFATFKMKDGGTITRKLVNF